MLVQKVLVIVTIFISLVSAASAQMSRKPSPTREPAGAMDKRPDSKKNSLLKIGSRAEFETVGRVYHRDTPYAMLHAMFVIDRKNNNKIYYVNSQRFRFHKDFLYATGLAALGTDIYKAAYFPEDRRFIVGTIAWQKAVEKWTWELWEGDLANADHIKTATAAINKTFYEKVYFKPNSNRQDDASANIGVERITQDELNKNQEYLALNTGKAVGRIHIIDKLDDTVEIGDNEIVILKELPVSLPPVRGIIVAKPSSPLSHINILAKGWDVPNVYIKDADKLFREMDTWWVELDASLTNYKIKRVVDFDPSERPEIPKPPDQQIAPVNLGVKKLTSLRAMRKRNSVEFGSKAANLGEIMNARLPGFIVPEGFSVPFYWYDKFMKDNGLDKAIVAQMDEYDFVHNPRYRRQKLDEFRAKVQKGTFDEALRKEIIARWKSELAGKPVFVRSSSNSEDLPNFSGAGLYSSVPNVVDENGLIEAVKKVWGSLWKFEAYEARVRNYVDQESVYMSALIQVGINMDKSGVLITKDPFDRENKNSVYISTVCGLGQNVVNNKGIPEQTLFNPRSNAVILMTYSDQKNALTFDASGDLKEIPDKCANPATKRILNDAQVRSLAGISLAIRRAFGNRAEQDIEWGIMKGRIYIVQSRPYIEN
ncbi:MAG: PEP/pyruvate-binding domain-containing protein [Acidobacteria bacterium]|nr:PEP/pyruvate-binding domain-containing protein [Acidobacteriota bacterium]MBK8812237.1 PEP/pyruvate-binding domain-containing protein [Acidobacteriota bacterium]